MNEYTVLIAELFVKSTLVLLLLFGCISRMDRASAAHRSLVWLVGFIVVLVLPLISIIEPYWKVELPTVMQSEVSAPPLETAQVAQVSNEMANSFTPAPESSVEWSWMECGIAFYLTGILYVFGFRFLGSFQLARLKREAGPVGANLESKVMRMAEARGIRRQVQILESDSIRVPMTWGVRNPILMLPKSASDWTPPEWSAALEHELEHIRNFDAARRWLGTAVSALWWPHPLVWLAGRSWRIEQERACDDAVLRSGADGKRYASQLIDAVRSMRLNRFQNAAALVMAMPSGLETRLRAVVTESVNRSAVSNRAKILGACGGALLITFAAVCGAQTAQEPKSKGKVIAIFTKFIDVAADAIVNLPPELKGLAEGSGIVLDGFDLEKWVQIKGVDLMSSPTVTTKSGQTATIEVARDFIYPTALEKDGVTPANFVSTKVGIIVETMATRRKDGSLDLKVHPTVREFEGFTIPSQPGKVFDAKGVNGPLKKGDLTRPIFIERTSKSDVNVRPGQWLIHGLRTPPDVAGLPPEKQPSQKRVWVLVRAEEIDPETAKAPPPVSKTEDEAAVTIMGAVKRQGKYTFREGMKLSDLMTEAQGLASDADPDSIVIKRSHVKGKSISTLYPARNSFVPLQPGDQVVVGKQLDEASAAIGRKLNDLIFPQVEFKAASLNDVVAYLRSKSRELDADGVGVNLTIGIDIPNKAEISMSVKNVSLRDLLGYVTALSNTSYSVSAAGVLIHSVQKEEPAPAPSAQPEKKTSSANTRRAKEQKVPQVEFSSATLDEAIEFLCRKSQNLDPEKTGVNIILQGNAKSASARLTLSLREVSIWDALNYCAQLAGLQLKESESAIILLPAD